MGTGQMKVRDIIQKEASWKSLEELLNALEESKKINVEEVSTKEEIGRECSGFIYRKGDIFYIGIEKSQHNLRKRFTKAHELWHYFLHRDTLKTDELLLEWEDQKSSILFREVDGKVTNTDFNTSVWEIEANEFAAELLMPYDEVVKRVKRMQDAHWKILVNVLAYDFNVSIGAMEFRLKNLSIN